MFHDRVIFLICFVLLLTACQCMPMVLNNDVQHDQSMNQLQYIPAESQDQAAHLSNANSQGFSHWATWKGKWTSDPQCASIHSEGLDAFTVGLDGHIYYRAEHHGHLHHWQKLYGATAKFPPAVAVQRDGTIDVVIHGSDNVIYYTRRDKKGEWQSFESLHFRSYRRPGLAPWYHSGLFIFAIGTDGQMYKLERRHGEWFHGKHPRDWVCLGGSWTGGVTGGYISGQEVTNNVYVLAYDRNGYLQYTRFHVESGNSKLGNWVGHWTNLHVQGTLTPALSSRSNGFDIVIRTTNGQLAVNSYDLRENSWLGWVHFRFTTYTIPGIASHSSGFLYLFALDNNQQMHVCHRRHPGADFTSWSNLGGPYTSSPSAIVREDRFIDVFVLNKDHDLVVLGARLHKVLVGL